MEKSPEKRRRDAVKTKARILSAAQKAFAEFGYSQTGIRHVASLADVDSALIQRYFGSKAGLFEAALADSMPNFDHFNRIHTGSGERLTAQFLADLFDLRAHSMIVLSANDQQARGICARMLKQLAIKPLAEWLGPPNAEVRAARMIMLATGFMLFTRQVQLMVPDEATCNGTSEWMSVLLQDLVEATEGANIAPA